MSYQVIARRWRPKQFTELVGQDHIIRTLKNAIERQRIAHAYLFVGPRGTGKTSAARLFAKALNCEDGPSINPPNDSPICKAIMAGSCMDVIEIDGASNNSVDQVRTLREDCQYAPATCRFKIYIIDEVHMLTGAAFNALLKTLEEPPSHVKFIFATTESHKVLPTIVSRCQRFEFRPIPESLIIERLDMICQTEGITADPVALQGIARLANGGMRDAQSILDQMISFCGDKISESDVLDVYGLASQEKVGELTASIARADYGALVTLVEELAAEGRDLYRVLLDLQVRFREALLVAIAKQSTVAKLGASLTAEQLLRALEALHSGEISVQRGLSEKVNFEVTLLRAVEASRFRAIDTVIKELAELANELPPESGEKKNKLGTIGLAVKFPDPPAQQSAFPPKRVVPVSRSEGLYSTEEIPEVDAGEGEDMWDGPPIDQLVPGGFSEEHSFTQTLPPPVEEAPVKAPNLYELEDRVPESNRALLKELLGGDFREVRRIKKAAKLN